jgi:hypothetical protein
MNITFRGLSLSFPAISSSKPTEGSNGTQRGLAKLRRFFLVLIFEGKKVCKLAGRWPFEIPNPFPGYKFSMVKKPFYRGYHTKKLRIGGCSSSIFRITM